jgi:AcrR family transcriptional regulator
VEGSRTSLREDPEARRLQLLDEAIHLVGERGSNGFRIQELAQRCGLSNAGLLYHFGTKEELLLAMLQELQRRETIIFTPFAQAAERELEQGTGSKKALLAFLRAMAERVLAHPELGLPFTILLVEALDGGHHANQYFRDRDTAILDLFARLLAPHVEHPLSAARQLLALQDGLGQQWVRGRHNFDVVVEWERAVTAVLGASVAPPAISNPIKAKHCGSPSRGAPQAEPRN